jgi:hypothetical protein
MGRGAHEHLAVIDPYGRIYRDLAAYGMVRPRSRMKSWIDWPSTH